MRIARRTFLTSSIGTAVAPAILRLARADTPPITLKLHHSFSAVSGVHDKFLVPWASKIETESGGKMHVDIFPSMQLERYWRRVRARETKNRGSDGGSDR